MPKRKSSLDPESSPPKFQRHSKGDAIKDALEDISRAVLTVRNELAKEERRSNSQQVKDLQGTIDKLHEELSKEKKAKEDAVKIKEDALTRLSAVAASRLRDNNPGITDLSDPNRPIKLGEKASEIYDNEWTNALENIQELRKDDKKSDDNDDDDEAADVGFLLNILTRLFEQCKADATEHLDSISRSLVVPSTVKLKGKDVPSVTEDFLKQIKDFRKQQCTDSVLRNICQHYFDTFSKLYKKELSMDVILACKEFILKCTELCWLMSIQDPPMHMEWKFNKGSKFKSEKMRSFTKSGDLVKYVVWPALFLHVNGPLVSKAVVQGLKSSDKKKKK